MKTIITITVETKFKKFTEKDFYDEGDKDNDLTHEVEEDFHSGFYKLIEDKLTEDEGFEQEVLEKMDEIENDALPKKVNEFQDLGNISFRIFQEKVKEE